MCNTDRLVKKLSMNNLIASDRCYTFHHFCEYKEVYRHDKSNDYSKLVIFAPKATCARRFSDTLSQN